MLLAQIDITAEDLDTLWLFITRVGIPFLSLVGLIWIVHQQNSNTGRQSKTIDDLVRTQKEDKEELEKRLDSTQQSFDKERRAWDTERETFLDERKRLKDELERSTTNESDMGKKIKELTNDVEALRQRVNDLVAERELDKIEKKQILDEAARVKEQNKALRIDNTSITRERNTLELLIGEQSARIASMEKRVTSLEEALKFKDHELSKAYGTITTLSANLSKLTDETQEIPPFDAIENAGNDEVVTPVLNMELNIEDSENTTIVTPAEESADNNVNEDNDDKEAA